METKQPQITRSKNKSIRVGNISFNERWSQQDKGLITCWDRGRELRIKDLELALKTEIGELPVLGWKGGVDKVIKKKQKYGCLNYLAQWQGLRGEDLNINRNQEIEITCTKTNMKVIFTSDQSKYEKA
ncbi:MAG: hypothetical protein KAT04_11230 [Methylococcales bacterium]|nr:hypothetical protein [Methylococcales bacterium]